MMVREQKQWESPKWEIILFDSQDVIRTSGNSVTVEGSGFGQEVGWNDLFND